jgi:hypothetical protein
MFIYDIPFIIQNFIYMFPILQKYKLINLVINAQIYLLWVLLLAFSIMAT